MAVTRLGKGTGNRATSAGSATLGTSWTSFSIGSSDANTVAVVLVNGSVSTNTATTLSVTYGGVAMTALSLNNYGTTSTTRGFVGIYYLYNPPTGAQTVAITTSGATKTAVAGIDVSFSGVDPTIGSAQTATTTTHSVTSVANGYSLRVLSNGVTTGTLNQTSEYAAGSAVTGLGDFIAVQSAVGTGSSISFTASGTATTPTSIGVALSPYVAPIPSPAISTLTDDFNSGSTPDAAKWTASIGSPAALTSGNLVMPGSSILDALATYDFTSDAMYFQAKAVVASLAVGAGAGGVDVGWQFNSSSQAEVFFDGAGTGVTRTHTSGDWYRLRESGGTFFFDYSTNGTSWTNLSTQSTVGYTVTGLNVRFHNLGASSATFDNFNIPGTPSATNTGAFFAVF